MLISEINLKQYIDIIKEIAISAGKILLDKRSNLIIVNRKTDYHDIATSADLASENFIIAALKREFPNTNILAEESGKSDNKSELTWIIDPLDGTKEYVRGLPYFNVSIALELNHSLILGVVYQPLTKELFFGADQFGAYTDQVRMKVNANQNINEAFIYTHLPSFKDESEAISRSMKMIDQLVRSAYRVRAFPDDVMSLMRVAQGAADAFYLSATFPKWWDVAAGILCVLEAGGKVSDSHGNLIKNRDLSNGLVATNGKIHQQILNLINN